MPRAKLKDLTLKQRTFAEEYVHTKGNGTRAAKNAGYADSSAHVRASELVRKSNVVAVINELTRKHDVSADRVLTRLDNLSAKAEEANDYSTAAKCEIALGKTLGMFIERKVNVNIDVGEEHLRALRERMEKRRQAQDIEQ